MQNLESSSKGEKPVFREEEFENKFVRRRGIGLDGRRKDLNCYPLEEFQSAYYNKKW